MRRENKELEFLWRPDYAHSGSDTQIFTHLFWHHYSVPEFFKIKVHDDLIVSETLETEAQWDEFLDKLNDHLV